MLRPYLIAIAMLVFPGFAQAADLPSRSLPPPVYAPPLPLWTGGSVGAQIGYGFGHSNIVNPFAGSVTNSSPDGILGGVHAAYNYQYNQLVVGFEGDIDGSSISKSAFDPVTGGTLGTRIPVEGSFRGRAGIAWDRVLLYGTGGLAAGQISTEATGVLTPIPIVATSLLHVGWTAGAGIDYALTNNWSVRGEYRYTDFGYSSTMIHPVANHVTENAVRFGFSYKFEMYAPPRPVVAKY